VNLVSWLPHDFPPWIVLNPCILLRPTKSLIPSSTPSSLPWSSSLVFLSPTTVIKCLTLLAEVFLWDLHFSSFFLCKLTYPSNHTHFGLSNFSLCNSSIIQVLTLCITYRIQHLLNIAWIVIHLFCFLLPVFCRSGWQWQFMYNLILSMFTAYRRKVVWMLHCYMKYCVSVSA